MSRLTILTEEEQREFDYPPILSVEARSVSFAIDDVLHKTIRQLRKPINKVGFLLQIAYFKSCKRFFNITRFRQEDINYAAKLIGVPLTKINLSQYQESTTRYHQTMILALCHYKAYCTQTPWIEKEIRLRVVRVLEPKTLFFEILDQLHHHHVQIPSYNTLAELIADHYMAHENTLLNKIEQGLTQAQKASLKTLLSVTKNNAGGLLNRYKKINQSMQPKAIQASVRLFEQIQNRIVSLLPLLKALSLTPQACEYYAIWVKKSQLSQLKQLPDERKLYLYLMAFLQHQYYVRQDLFVDVVLKAVQTAKNSAVYKLAKADSLSRSERRSAVQHLTKTHRHTRELIDEISEISHSSVLTDTGKVEKINALLAEHAKRQDEKEEKKLALFEKSLDDMSNDKDYYDILENLSKKLQNRVSNILQVLIFNKDNSNNDVFDAVRYLKDTDGKITDKAPINCLDARAQTALTSDKGTFRVSLYKILIYIHIANAIKSGALNLKYSYRYLAIQDYLIDASSWKEQREELLALAALEKFSDYDTVIHSLKETLDKKYQSVNQHFNNQLNPYLSINEDKNDRFHVHTPAIDEKETKHIAALLNQRGYVPILRILSDINQTIKFTTAFTHHAVKHTKTKPQNTLFFAGIIGLGCNIGIPKIAQISTGINQQRMSRVINWYFSLKTLHSANERIRALIHQLALPTLFASVANERHSSSDGRKVGVAVDCLLATHSFKYFGQDKGVSIYTFIDDRQVLFHHTVISASAREAAYVIDGINNQNVEKIDIHSTDTHGYTELIFATTHCLDVAFAPRIKEIGKQNIYAFSMKKTYENLGYKLLPSRTINQGLIKQYWEDVLRFMATIKLKKVSASQLFKRLSSYAKENPLYKALKEFGRIIKSQFILTYFDDVTLRQRIEKQLNLIESSNKFSKAIFYANNSEFKQADPVEQKLAVACKVLIQNSIVLWNYLYLSEIVTHCHDKTEQTALLSLIQAGSVLTWSHVNLQGEFNFKQKAANDSPFDMDKILALRIN